eukprot:EG_transcript_12548
MAPPRWLWLLLLAGWCHPTAPTAALGALSVQAFPNRVYQQMVGVRIAAVGAEYVCFTLDGRPPACSGSQALSCRAGIFSLGDAKILTITSDHTIITAVGCQQEESTVIQAAHVRLPPATPTLSPPGGVAGEEVGVAAAGADRMCYTVDAEDPVCGPGDPPCLRGALLLGDRAVVRLPAADECTLRVVGCSAGGAGWVATGRYTAVPAAPLEEDLTPTVAEGPAVDAADPVCVVEDNRGGTLPAEAAAGEEPEEQDGPRETETTPPASALGPPSLHLSQSGGHMLVTVSAGAAAYSCHTLSGVPPLCRPPDGCAEGVPRPSSFQLSSIDVGGAFKVVGCAVNASSPAVTLHLVLQPSSLADWGTAFLVALAIVSTVAAHCMLHATSPQQDSPGASVEATELHHRLLQVQQMMEAAARNRDRQAVQWEQQLAALKAEAEAL